MTKDEFYAAKILEDEFWEFLYISDDGAMVFSRVIGGVTFCARVAVDR